METTNNRTPTRCREWERQRRNKFNDALSKLCDIVKAILKSNDTSGKAIEDVQYPKIEIIQKAIICLNNCVLEKTQLKAEILALQVELDAGRQKKLNRKDASTQVCTRFNNKSKSNKHVKLLMVPKPKRTALKEKLLSTNITHAPDIPQKLPKLLPRFTDNKGPENTFVVLPAAPYIFPQRPLLFPTAPPTILFVDQNLQTLNKSTVPMVRRNSGDVTKTTMVNILPISAYTLSVTKSKKSLGKPKGDITKRMAKKSKTVKCSDAIIPEKVMPIKETEPKENISEKIEIGSSNIVSKGEVTSMDIEVKSNTNNKGTQPNEKVNLDKNNTNIEDINVSINKPSNKMDEAHNICKIHCTESLTKVTSGITNSNVEPKVIDSIKTTIENKTTSIAVNKLPEVIPEDKDKENKLPNILDTALCDSTVDGGNARLELAEEFLAASPTAAFLMSFPLVSGNRADSPAEEAQNTVQNSNKDIQRRNEPIPQPDTYFEKTNSNELKKSSHKIQPSTIMTTKQNQPQKVENIATKQAEATKVVHTTALTNVSTENPFLNLPMTSLISTSCTLSDTAFGLDFDCNIGKTTIPSQPTSFVSNNNLFYKSDPFSTVKNTIYSTSSISSSHEYNGLGLYPCAMEKYSSKNKPDFSNVEDNLMKIGSSRLTYDIDLGWSHKGFDFVNCTTAPNAYNKDILTTASAPYSTAYNPFNPEFHVPLVSSTNKKENNATKSSSSFAESMTSFYSQPSNLWTDDAPFYTNSSLAKSLTTKHQNYLPVDHVQTNLNMRANSTKQYEAKHIPQAIDNTKHSNTGIIQPISDKYTKKSPNKMHINWMTSEIRPMQNNCNVINADIKSNHKPAYIHPDTTPKKQDLNEANYFPIHNFATQPAQEEFQVWPSARPLGTTEISIEPPPINLPTLVGDLALGPHDKKKNADSSNSRTVPPVDVQNCSNFLSVTQLMNRSTDMSTRHQGPHIELPKSNQTKQNLNIPHFSNDGNRKSMISRLESHNSQPCYVFNEPKPMNSYDNMTQFSQPKSKTNNKTDKSSKTHKNNNYSAEALIRGGNCTQKVQDSSNAKFMMPAQKYNDYNPQDSSVAQVSHFPPILDYSDNSYTGQQFSGTTLYNTTTNTISNSFYSNFMPGSSNLMSGNYAGGPFASDFIDYNQTPECSYTNHKYEEFKMRNNPTVFQSEKMPSNYKTSRRESTAKHKLECSKKETNKKYQSKRAKPNNDAEEWNDTSHLLWQNKPTNKRHSNFISDELPFPNYVGNQMPTQYQPELFNSHLMPSNVQGVGHNSDRTLSSFPATSRANFNLSTIFPEITMKVQ